MNKTRCIYKDNGRLSGKLVISTDLLMKRPHVQVKHYISSVFADAGHIFQQPCRRISHCKTLILLKLTQSAFKVV